MSEYSRFLLTGSGGQGVITMGILLAETAALHSGLNAVQSQSYGPEARGGATRSDVLISPKPIYYPKVQVANVLVCLNQASLDRYLGYLAPGALLLTDSRLVNASGRLDAELHPLPMHDRVMEEFGKPQVFNICVLGALTRLTGVVGLEDLEKTLAERFAPAFFENNKKALHLGWELAGEPRTVPC
jgi:2-oxoglutarate ferredoxin oxidoreductase subunit gamma